MNSSQRPGLEPTMAMPLAPQDDGEAPTEKMPLMPREESLADHGIVSYPLEFNGRGGEYFRVWIVNLLLTLVSLSLYTPVARWRTIRYFYGNTVVAGSPLEFTGSVRRMMFGYLVFVGLYLAYAATSYAEHEAAAAVVLLLWVALTPWLWVNATRFRLGSTRWRGIAFRFSATTREAYAASRPYLGLLAWIAAVGALATVLKVTGVDAGLSSALMALVLLAGLLGALVCIVMLEFNAARLRVLRTDFGGEQGRWKPRLADFLRISAVAFGVFLAIGLALAVLLGVGLSLSGLRESLPPGRSGWMIFAAITGVLSLAAMYFAISPALAYREARKFVLVWHGNGIGQVARLKCSLRPWAFVRLRVMNVILTLLTLGMYRPFALVSEYRMKLTSLTLYVKGNADALQGRLTQRQGALGDAMADAVGFDMLG